jgi:hypothetical protein
LKEYQYFSRNTIGNGTVVTIDKAPAQEKIAAVATQLSFQAQRERQKRVSSMRRGIGESLC